MLKELELFDEIPVASLAKQFEEVYVPGPGPVRRKRLLAELGSMRKVKAATLEELQALPWLPDAVAENHLNGASVGR